MNRPVGQQALAGGTAAPAEPAGAREHVPQKDFEKKSGIAALLQRDMAWRKVCLAAVGKMPSGYTYLTQLMGHDMGSSIRLDELPYVLRHPEMAPALPGDVGPPRPVRYNMIENPLTLETVYGPGSKVLSHLFDPLTLQFRIDPGQRLTRVFFVAGQPTIHALYDERNRSTLMLHELTAAWMRFHNLCMRALKRVEPRLAPSRAYARVRCHAVRVWHEIIKEDLLPMLLHPEVRDMPPGKLEAAWELGETALLHGLFRACHAMPLGEYDLGQGIHGFGVRKIALLMKTGYEPSNAEEGRWTVNWPLFFGRMPGGPLTGISASVEPSLNIQFSNPQARLARLDAQTARQTGLGALDGIDLVAAIAALPEKWRRRVEPAALATAFGREYARSPFTLTGEILRAAPLYLLLMVEAQLYGKDGSFGPLGSALLRKTILAAIDRVSMPPGREELAPELSPKTMLDLFTTSMGE